MNGQGRSYAYVGPPELTSLVRPGSEGWRVCSAVDFERWVAGQSAEDLAEPFTFVVDLAGVLRPAARRSEHVVCSGGNRVLSAGEVRFRQESGQWSVAEVSNHSTGYCPDVSSWPAVAEALDPAGIDHPPGFTHEVVFRRCPSCGQLNIVREDDWFCVFCDEGLPQEGNVDGVGRSAARPPHRSR